MQGLAVSSGMFALLLLSTPVLQAADLAKSDASSNTVVEKQEVHEEHGAHEHGVGTLSIAIADKVIEINLDSPAANVFGFEHKASSEADKKVVAEASAKLEAGGNLFDFDKAAQCKFEKAELNTGQDELSEEEKAAEKEPPTEENMEANHLDVGVNWVFGCEQPASLKTITPKLFANFPAFERLEVEWVSDQGASAQTLEKDQAINLTP